VRRHGLLIFFAVLIVYLSFPTKNYYWDGISYAQEIEDGSAGPWYLHPNHLLYAPLGQQLWLAADAAGLNLRALTVLQILSMVTGAATAAVLFFIALELGLSRYAAACLSLAFAFSATWWKFATDADNYIASTFLITVCFWLLVRRERSSPFVVGIVLCAAMLLHQLAALFAPAAMLALWLEGRGDSLGRRLGDIVVFMLSAGLPTAGLYVLVFYTRHDAFTAGEFMRWVMAHSEDSAFSFTLLSNIWISIVGHFKLVFGGNLRMVLEQRSPVSMVAGATMALSLLIILVRFIQNPPRLVFPMREKMRRLLPVLALWCGTYAVFLVFWLPRNTFYRLFYLPALVLLCAPLLAAPKTKYNRLALTVAALFLLNFGFYIYPQTKAEANPNLPIAEQFRSIWTPGDVVYWDVFAADNRTIRYFNPQVQWREVWGQAYLSQIEASFRETGRVWFDSAAFARFRQRDPELRSWLLARGQVREIYEFPIGGHVVGFLRLEERKLRD
jgi:hypothetical protein